MKVGRFRDRSQDETALSSRVLARCTDSFTTSLRRTDLFERVASQSGDRADLGLRGRRDALRVHAKLCLHLVFLQRFCLDRRAGQLAALGRRRGLRGHPALGRAALGTGARDLQDAGAPPLVARRVELLRDVPRRSRAGLRSRQPGAPGPDRRRLPALPDGRDPAASELAGGSEMSARLGVLVTGAAGFVGSNVVEHFLARGDRVRGIDCLDDYYDVRRKRRPTWNPLRPLTRASTSSRATSARPRRAPSPSPAPTWSSTSRPAPACAPRSRTRGAPTT